MKVFAASEKPQPASIPAVVPERRIEELRSENLQE
jgi:hypothetical protein